MVFTNSSFETPLEPHVTACVPAAASAAGKPARAGGRAQQLRRRSHRIAESDAWLHAGWSRIDMAYDGAHIDGFLGRRDDLQQFAVAGRLHFGRDLLGFDLVQRLAL